MVKHRSCIPVCPATTRVSQIELGIISLFIHSPTNLAGPWPQISWFLFGVAHNTDPNGAYARFVGATIKNLFYKVGLLDRPVDRSFDQKATKLQRLT